MSDASLPCNGPHLAAHARAIALCAACPKLCRHQCPVAEAEQRETVTPWALMTAAYVAGKGLAPSDTGAAAWPFHCSSCRACQVTCKFANDVPGAIHSLRAERFVAGTIPPEARSALERYRSGRGNMYQPGVLERLRGLVSPHHLDPGAPALVIVDPTTIVRYPEVVRAADKLLDVLQFKDVAFFVDRQLSGCGHVYYDTGDFEGFARYARQIHRAVGSRERIYTLRPSDAHLLRDIYPQFGIRWDCRIGAFLELVASRQDRLPRAEAAPPLVLHQACHLARSLDAAELPIALITRVVGQAPRVPAASGQETPCCGGGGGLPIILPGVASQVSRLCIERLAPGDDDLLVTTCSTCRRQLEKVSESPVQDILPLLAGMSRRSGES